MSYIPISKWQANMAEHSDERVHVLAVLPDVEDRDRLSGIISHTKWKLDFATTFEEARAALQAAETGAVVSECCLPGGFGWRDVLRLTEAIENAPPVIVTDRLADERLWAEVLNERGYDVLMKPFDCDEVFRVVSHAWRSWKDRNEHAARRKPARSADSLGARNLCAGTGA